MLGSEPRREDEAEADGVWLGRRGSGRKDCKGGGRDTVVLLCALEEEVLQEEQSLERVYVLVWDRSTPCRRRLIAAKAIGSSTWNDGSPNPKACRVVVLRVVGRTVT